MTLQAGISTTVMIQPYSGTNIGGYAFDAFLKIDHQSVLEITKHPVQTGANITDHCFRQPRIIEFEIGMSDVAPQSRIAGQFENAASQTNVQPSVSKINTKALSNASSMLNLITPTSIGSLMSIQSHLSNIKNMVASRSDITQALNGMAFVPLTPITSFVMSNLNKSIGQTKVPVSLQNTNQGIVGNVDPQGLNIKMTSSRGINAYLVLSQLQQNRIPITVTTRLGAFPNMLVREIRCPDDYTTKFGLKATVVMEEAMLASVKRYKISDNANKTDSTNRGNLSGQTVSPAYQAGQALGASLNSGAAQAAKTVTQAGNWWGAILQGANY